MGGKGGGRGERNHVVFRGTEWGSVVATNIERRGDYTKSSTKEGYH